MILHNYYDDVAYAHRRSDSSSVRYAQQCRARNARGRGERNHEYCERGKGSHGKRTLGNRQTERVSSSRD